MGPGAEFDDGLIDQGSEDCADCREWYDDPQGNSQQNCSVLFQIGNEHSCAIRADVRTNEAVEDKAAVVRTATQMSLCC
jgi:hypothetical protein